MLTAFFCVCWRAHHTGFIICKQLPTAGDQAKGGSRREQQGDTENALRDVLLLSDWEELCVVKQQKTIRGGGEKIYIRSIKIRCFFLLKETRLFVPSTIIVDHIRNEA